MEEQKHRVLSTKADYDDFLFKDPYFAFLDILGFSTLVQKNQHASLVELYDTIFSEEVIRVDEMMKKISDSKAESQGEKYTKSGLRIVNISDSILIWTNHGQPSALFEIVFAVSTLLGISMIQGLPLRGCITRQKFTVRERGLVTSVIGRGLVHAYSEEKKQQWSGCIVDSEIINYFRSIEKHVGRWERPAEIERDELVYEYDIPIFDSKEKTMTTEKGYAVNWFDPLITEDIIRESFDAHNKKDETQGSYTSKKIENTVAFHNFCLDKRRQKNEAIERFGKALDEASEEGPKAQP